MSGGNRQNTNYYEVLEVSPDAAQNEIHRAYQRAKATYAVDNPALYTMFSKEEAQELLSLIEEAYSVLGNQSQRKIYDQGLLQSGGRAPSAAPPQASTQSQTSVSQAAARESVAASATSSAGESVGESYVIRKSDAPRASLPEGMGRTSISTYRIDQAVEEALKSATDWDGSLLQKARTYKNVSLEQMSEATRISKTYLAAVEACETSKLPAAVFVRGFVVQMARVLNLDENKVATSYMKIFREKSAKPK